MADLTVTTPVDTFMQSAGYGAANATAFTLSAGTNTAASGASVGLSFAATYNLTSTATATDILSNRTQTAVGSGAQKLADFQVGGTSWYSFATGNTATTGGFNSSSTVETAVTLAPVINQTSTAGYTALKVNVTETATGSGAKALLDLQVGGSSKVTIASTGSYTQTGTGTNTFGGNTIFPNGSNTNPSVVFTGASTTGLYWANPGIGFSVAGASVGTWTASALTTAKPLITTPSALTYASPTSVDVTLSSCFTVTTVNGTGSVTFNATAGGTAGQEMTILITNDATSAKTITFGTNFLSTGTLTASAASRHTSITFKSDGTSWYETGRAVLTA